MRTLAVSLLLSLNLLATPGISLAAETDRYVIDVIWVSLRSGPSTDFKVVDAGLRSGTKMTMLGESEDGKWLNVELANSEKTQGWIPKRYITETPIARDRLKTAEQEIQRLKSNLDKTSTNLQSLQSTSEQATGDLASISKERDELKKELERIREVSANALTLDLRNGELLQENQELKNELDVLKIENQYLSESNVSREWMVGGSIAFIGLLAGVILARGAKRGGSRDSWA